MAEGADAAGEGEDRVDKSVTIEKAYRTLSVSAKGGYNSYQRARRIGTTSAHACSKLDLLGIGLGQKRDGAWR
jgi:hypothetical protein